MRIGYTRLYTRDDGTSGFEDMGAELTTGFAVPPAAPLYSAQFDPAASGAFWIGAQPDWDGGLHPVPRRMVFVTVRGEYEVKTSDGNVQNFPIGSVLLLEDTAGVGHSTKVVGDEDLIVFAVGLPLA